MNDPEQPPILKAVDACKLQIQTSLPELADRLKPLLELNRLADSLAELCEVLKETNKHLNLIDQRLKLIDERLEYLN